MGGVCSGKSSTSSQNETGKKITRAQVAQHNKPNDCWIIIDDIVYDVSEYWKVHPGGGSYILAWAGKDATFGFREFNHSPYAVAQLKSLGIAVGKVYDEPTTVQGSQMNEEDMSKQVKDLEDLQLLGNDNMFCFQCQQTVKNQACTSIGVCGKSPKIAALQDLIVHYVKGVSIYAQKPELFNMYEDDLLDILLYSMFATLTNVNYNTKMHIDILKRLSNWRDKLKAKFDQLFPQNKDNQLKDPNSPCNFQFKEDLNYLLKEAQKVGLLERKKTVVNEDLFSLLEMCIYGMKGACAYFYHAEQLRLMKKDIYPQDQRLQTFKELFLIMAQTTEYSKFSLEYLLGLNMNCGKQGLTIMSWLDKGHNDILGSPIPSDVPRTPVEGNCILISGHDLTVLKKLLIATEGKGINIYTHSEMLPAFGYPELKKHKHLVANFGGAWYDQNYDFANFPGSILMTSNCLIQPKSSYRSRLFTTHMVGWDDIKQVINDDFTELINCAKQSPGFKKSSAVVKKYSQSLERCGYGFNTMAGLLVQPIKDGHIKEIYLIGGCDNLNPERDFYRQCMLQLPKSTIVLTLGCGKFRLLGQRETMGSVPNCPDIPRILDVGQCNDAYSAVKVALALADILKCGVNDLPLHLVLSWVEQKAVVILLTLLHLGVKNIVIGPNLPAFLTPNVINYLVKNFSVSTTYSNSLCQFKQEKFLVSTVNGEFKQGSVCNEFQQTGPFKIYKVQNVQKVAKDTKRITFAFDNPGSVFSLPCGQHLLIRARDEEGNIVTRAYTPITKQGTKGSFDMIIKIYPTGFMSKFLDTLQNGNLIEMQGNVGGIIYSPEKGGSFNVYGQMMNPGQINMISGGTSVVSMYNIIQSILSVPDNKNEVSLLYTASNKEFLVLQKEFEQFQQQGFGRIKINITTSAEHGRIDKEKFNKFLFPPKQSGQQVTIIGGPSEFRKAAILLLKEMKYDTKSIIQFY